MAGSQDGTPVREVATNTNIRVCERCGLRYDWRRSPSSSLKMTYCGSLCERAALGFTIDALLQNASAPAGSPAVKHANHATGANARGMPSAGTDGAGALEATIIA